MQHWLIEQTAQIAASPALLFELLGDVGGWRMWNRQVHFAELEHQPSPGVTGLLYLQRWPSVRWRLEISQWHPPQALGCQLRLPGLRLQVLMRVQQGDTLQHSQLQIQVMPLSHLAQLGWRWWQPSWQAFMAGALEGIAFAAEQAQQHQRQPPG